MLSFIKRVSQLSELCPLRSICKTNRRRKLRREKNASEGIVVSQNQVEKFTLKEALEKVIEDAKDGKESDFYKASLKLNINLKNTEQVIRVVLSYPHAIGTTKPSALIFTKPELHDIIRKYEFEIGTDSSLNTLLKEQEVPWKFIIATTDAFEPFKDNAKTLGLKKFMPNKKSKTLIDPIDLENKLKELCKGIYEVKNDSGKNVNTIFGRKKLTYDELNENLRYLIETISSKKATTVKGNLIKAAYISFKKGKSYLLHQKVLNAKNDNYLK